MSILLSLSSCKDIQNQRLFGRRSLKKALLWAQQDSIRVADSLKRAMVIEGTIDDTVQDFLVIPEEEILTEEASKDRFHLIVGTYANSENAKLVAKQFRDQGYQPSIIKRTIDSGKILNMVSVKSFTDYEEALNYRIQFHSNIDSTAWLFQSE